MMSENRGLGWMYEGAKSLINREDYLLGKKIGKDFEKYSDVVNEQKPEAFDAVIHTRTVTAPQPSAVKTSALETYVVATEDPLVAVKVKEETRRRELLENPLMKLKFKKMLKEMMAEKECKGEKKKKKKKKDKKERSAVDEEDVGPVKKKKKRKKSHESSEEDYSMDTSRRTKSFAQRERDYSSAKFEKGSKCSHELKPKRVFEEAKRLKRTSPSPTMWPKRKSRHDSSRSSSSSESRNRKNVYTNNEKRRCGKSSSSRESSPARRQSLSKVQKPNKQKQEESKHKECFTGFGLVGGKKKDELPNTTENPYELSRRPVPPVYKKPESRGSLTEEEKQKRLIEMARNAQWRQEIRKSNIKVVSMREAEEAAEDLSGKAPSFLRSQINTAAADLTVEQRLQSKKKSLQRSHGYMEQKFTSK